MDNSNAQPSVAPKTEASTPTTSTPDAGTPSSSTPTSSTPVVPQKSETDKKGIVKAVIGAAIIIAALIGLNVASKAISKHNAEKHLDETIEVCNDKGYYSSECEELRDKYGVTCNVFTGDCEIEYKYTIFF